MHAHVLLLRLPGIVGCSFAFFFFVLWFMQKKKRKRGYVDPALKKTKPKATAGKTHVVACASSLRASRCMHVAGFGKFQTNRPHCSRKEAEDCRIQQYRQPRQDTGACDAPQVDQGNHGAEER